MCEQYARFKCEWRNCGHSDIKTNKRVPLQICRDRGCDGLFMTVKELCEKKCECILLEPLQKEEKKQQPPLER